MKKYTFDNFIGKEVKAGDLVRLKKDKNVAQVVDDVNKDWSEWEKVNYTGIGQLWKGKPITETKYA